MSRRRIDAPADAPADTPAEARAGVSARKAGAGPTQAGRRRLLASLPLAALPALSPTAEASSTSLPPASAGAVPRELALEWAGVAHLHGRGRLRFLGLHVYDIRLWTPQPGLVPEDWPRRPIALEIEYARSFSARAIAERSLDEMRRAGPLPAELAERWAQLLAQTMPDVKAGDRLTGVQQADGASRFFHNGERRGEVRDAEFTRRFFGIWLGETSSEPALRNTLLGRR
jgi:hypothetical protein